MLTRGTRHGVLKMFATLSIVLLVPALAGADENKPISERAEVSIVDVRVTATDSDGKPVMDLTESDFVVKDNGKKQNLVAAHLIGSGIEVTTPGAPKAPVTLRQPRHFLMLFDLTYNDLYALRNARMAALNFLRDDLAADDDVGVFTIDITEGVKMLMNFTRDREQVADALVSVDTTKGNLFLADSAGLVRLVPEERRPPVKQTWIAKGMDQGPKDIGAEETAFYHKLEKRSQVQDYRGAASTYLTSLRDFAKSVDVMPGRKAIMLFSSGFDEKALGGETLEEAEENSMYFLMGDFEKMDASTREVDSRNISMLEQAATFFSTSDCKVFCIDPSGNKDLSGSPDAPANAAFRNQTILEQLAAETGGEVFRHTNSYEEAMAKVSQATSAYYLLAFTAPQEKSGQYHEIDVEVRRPGVKITHRKGYYEDKPFEKYNSLERQLQIASVINEARSPAGIAVPTTAFVMPVCHRDSPGSAQVSEGVRHIEGIIEVPASALAQMGSHKGQDIEFFMFAVHEETRDVVGYSHGLARIPAGLVEKEGGKGGVRYLGVVTAPEGAYRILGIARDLQTGECAVGTSPVAVAPPEAFSVASCLLSEGGDWITVASNNKVGCQPLTFSGTLVAPKAEPALAGGQDCVVLVKVNGLARDPATGKPSMDLSVRVTDSQGTSAALKGYQFVSGNWLNSSDYEMMFRIKIPETLTRGMYTLDLEAHDRVTEKSALSRVGFEIGRIES